MNTDFDKSLVTKVVDLQLFAAIFALTTRNIDDQDEFIEFILKAIAKQSDESITKVTEHMGLPDTLRNELFAECAEYIANIKRATLGIARDMRD